MKICILKNLMEVSDAASQLIAKCISENPSALICTASGNTPTLTYDKLPEVLGMEQSKNLRIIKLDEWGGVSMNHPETCEQYIQKYVIRPLKISEDRYIRFHSDPENPENEAKRVQDELTGFGNIDICILGLGANGHIAFNEPANSLQPFCHVAKLSAQSLQHSMAKHMEQKPTYGITLGMANILHSKKIVMLIAGAGKHEIVRQFLSGEITTQIPASFLWLHPDVECFISSEAIPDNLQINLP